MKPTKKELRSEAHKIMDTNPLIRAIVIEITHTGNTMAAHIMPKFIKEAKLHNNPEPEVNWFPDVKAENAIAAAPIEPKPEPTKDDWKLALKLSEAFKSHSFEVTNPYAQRADRNQQPDIMSGEFDDMRLSYMDQLCLSGLPKKQGALNFVSNGKVYGYTGYVNARTQLQTSIVRYKCDCGNESWTTFQKIRNGQKVCSVDCPERKTRQRNRTRKQAVIDAAEDEGQKAAALANHIVDTMTKH